ncbi:hypothetical protein RA210_U10139 [Rubrivivax sp. A210]|nr:hypothetical protein RA210_U10139 [Rubrivivax sp. A210]
MLGPHGKAVAAGGLCPPPPAKWADPQYRANKRARRASFSAGRHGRRYEWLQVLPAAAERELSHIHPAVMQAANFKISTRIGGGFFVFVALTVLPGVLSILQLHNVAAAMAEMADTHLPQVQLTARMRDLLNSVRGAEARHLLSSARKEMKGLEAEMEAMRKKLAERDAAADRLMSHLDDRALLAVYREHRKSWFAASEPLTTSSRAGKPDEATNIYNGDSNTAFSAAMAGIVKFSEFAARATAAAAVASEAAYQNARQIVLVGVAIAVQLAVAISRSIARSIEAAVQAASQIADGDMTVDLHVVVRDETAQLLRSLVAMRLRLAGVLSTSGAWLRQLPQQHPRWQQPVQHRHATHLPTLGAPIATAPFAGPARPLPTLRPGRRAGPGLRWRRGPGCRQGRRVARGPGHAPKRPAHGPGRGLGPQPPLRPAHGPRARRRAGPGQPGPDTPRRRHWHLAQALGPQSRPRQRRTALHARAPGRLVLHLAGQPGHQP